MVFTSFIIGTAGSGKSYLTYALIEKMRSEKQKVAALNLDPGTISLPYSPDIDIRDYITTNRLMQEYNLGPNGALVMAADLIVGEIQNLKENIEEIDPDILLVDTPGQMELFAFRASGPFITKEITDEPKLITYLFDSVFSSNPVNYVSNMFLSSAVYTRFFLPQIHVLSKCDFLPETELNIVLEWADSLDALSLAIDKRLEGSKRVFSQRLAEIIYHMDLSFPLIAASSKTNKGLSEICGTMERIFTGGEKFTF